MERDPQAAAFTIIVPSEARIRGARRNFAVLCRNCKAAAMEDGPPGGPLAPQM